MRCTPIGRLLPRSLLAALVALTPACSFFFPDDDAPTFPGVGTPPGPSVSIASVRTFAGEPMTPVSPTLANAKDVRRFTIAPDLPEGLELDPDTGEISGSPVAPSPETTHTFTANALAFVPVPAGGSFEVVTPLASTTMSVEVFDRVAPSGLSYPLSPVNYATGASIAPNVPAVTGLATSFAIVPSLPASLQLDPATGIVTGTPSQPSGSTDYTVTASNPFGATTATLRIGVLAPGSSAVLTLHEDDTLVSMNTELPLRAGTATHRALPSRPSRVATSPDGRFAITACDGGELVRHDFDAQLARPGDGTVVATGRFPYVLEIDSTGTRLLMLEDSRFVSLEILANGTLGTEESVPLGGFPASIAVNAELVHVPLAESGQIATVRPLPMLTLVDSNPSAGGYPARIVPRGDGNTIYVFDSIGRKLDAYAVDRSGGPVLTHIDEHALSPSSIDVAVSDDKLWIASFEGGVSVRGLNADGTISSFPASPFVSGASGSYDSIRASGDDGVFLLDTINHEITAVSAFDGAVRRFRTRANPRFLAVVPGTVRLPASEWLFVASPATDELTALRHDDDGSGGNKGGLTPETTLATGDQPADVLTDRRRSRLYVANAGDGSITKFDLLPSAGLFGQPSSTSVGSAPSKLLVGPTDQLYVLDAAADAIHVLEPDATAGGLSALASVAGAAAATDFVLDPTGQYVWVSHDDGRVSRFDVDPVDGTLTLGGTTSVGSSLTTLATSPGGRFLYVADAADEGILHLDVGLDGSLTPGFFHPTAGAVSAMENWRNEPVILALVPSTEALISYEVRNLGNLATMIAAPTTVPGTPTTLAVSAQAVLAVGAAAPGAPAVSTVVWSNFAASGDPLADTLDVPSRPPVVAYDTFLR